MFDKITEQEVNNLYVQGAPDKLTGSAEENKRVFDKLPLMIVDKYNALVETVETELTRSDENIPTSNAVYKALDEKVAELGAGDMSKAVYDTDGSGVVDNAERLGGQLPEYYAAKSDVASSTEVVVGVTALSSAWVDETATTALWRCRLTNEAIKDNTIVNVYFDITDYTEEVASSLVRATNAGVLGTTTSGVGYVDIYATSQPDTDLACTLELTGYKVVG